MLAVAWIDVFNGDADGICALLQLRQAQPVTSHLITGVKRDIALLGRVVAGAADHVHVLDVSLDVNRAALLRLLDAGATVDYFDHHFAGDIPQHPRLRSHIDLAPDVCTSALVDRQLHGRFRPWASVGAFGDNLAQLGRQLAADCGFDAVTAARLQVLGEVINYNAYGETEADLWIAPAELFTTLRAFSSPIDALETEIIVRLRDGFAGDMAHALALAPAASNPGAALYVLPDAAWGRRVLGSFANELVRRFPTRAHAILSQRSDGTYTASVRAPATNPHGADALCRQFVSGGGRAAAAGVNKLPAVAIESFRRALFAAYPG